jgi:hypothetical protein
MKYILNNFLYSKKLLPNAVSQSLSHFVNAKNMVKKFVGHHLYIVANQPIAGRKLSQSLSHFANAKNIVKKFVGHHLHNAANQPIAGRKLSQSLSHFANAKNMVKKFAGHASNYVAYQMIAGRKLSHAILGRRENTRLKPDYLVNIFAILRFFPFLCDVNE